MYYRCLEKSVVKNNKYLKGDSKADFCVHIIIYTGACIDLSVPRYVYWYIDKNIDKYHK